MLKEWIVTLHRKEDLEDFYADMESPGGNLFIPNRAVEVAHKRLISRNTHYMLTHDEVALIKADDRVWDADLAELIDITTKPTGYTVASGEFDKSWTSDASDINWGLLRNSEETNRSNWGANGTSLVTDDLTITASGKNVDVVIVDGHMDPVHPEFAALDTSADYVSTAIVADASNGAVFDRSATVRGLKLVVAGAVGGQSTVPEEWAKKVAKMVELLINPTYPLINKSYQVNLINTLKGATGTVHAGFPAVQRVAYGGGSSYSPNFLTDEGIPSYSGYQAFLDAHATNDMVWYDNIQSPNPPTGDDDISELIEHLFHTIHLFGVMGAVPGSETALNWVATNNVNWKTTALHLAMKEAIDAGLYDPSGYAPDWATVADAAEVAYKEYMYLLNWSMWDMSTFWDGGSLSPEWSDTLKTPAGMLANNPLGHDLFKKYFELVLSKPDFGVLRDIFRDADAGVSNYQPSGTGGSRVQQFNWFSLTNAVSGGANGTYTYGPYVDGTSVDRTADNNHGAHCCGTVAGNTQGWARDANIYNISPYGTNPNALSSSLMWDYIRQWHNTKAINPATGRRNPTITNNSYGSSITTGQNSFGYPTKVVYRGVTFNPGRELTAAEMQVRGFYAPTKDMSIPYFFTSRNADMQDAINDGIIIVASAGNDYWKTVNSSDQDYANTFDTTYGGFNYTWYLHRGTGSGAGYAPIINVGATSNDTQEDKAPFSNVGSQVDIFAAGEAIQSSLHSGGINDPRNSSYQFGKYQGTSMSGPQVAGVLALLAESWPNITQAEAQAWLINKASVDQMQDTATDDPMDTNSLQGAPNLYLRWINQRVETGVAFPQKNFKPRPASGITYPRARIRRRG